MKFMMSVAFMMVLFFAFGASAVAVPLTDPQNPHNMSSNATHSGPKAQIPASGGTDRICVFCHTPHGAEAQSTLWNRKNINDVKTFPLYNSATLQIKNIAAAQYNSTDPAKYPNGASRMCLSCHDGNVAGGYGIGDVLNPPNTLTGSSSIAMEPGAANLDGLNSQIDLTESHPISFVYTEAVRAAIETYGPKASLYSLPDADTDVNLDGQNRMQCTACHDPHNATQLDGGGGTPKFWQKTNLEAADPYGEVCAACHLNFGLPFDEWSGAGPNESDHHNPGF